MKDGENTAGMEGAESSLPSAEHMMGEGTAPLPQPATGEMTKEAYIEGVIRTVAAWYGIPVEGVKTSTRRDWVHLNARRDVVKILRATTTLSWDAIGKALGQTSARPGRGVFNEWDKVDLKWYRHECCLTCPVLRLEPCIKVGK